MFTEKKGVQPQTSERNIIGKNTSIIGDVQSEGDFRIDGTVEGTIKTSGRVIIGSNGIVKGEVECGNADFEGTFSGKLVVSELLSLKKTANINGEVFINKLLVEPGAVFNASCTMKSGIKDLKKNGSQKAQKTA
ncbi:MAG: hypothetical protein BM563_10655 [Bacteroidetes bacterium MedPE-SWsnd-G1]|uniref:Polymer-forming cytoskeletal protein n=1 Tax=Urechidicola vernalis TaxID=3075600 RepID=A0ABU2Y613_9FLAO|nr:polymer-forming cytoskeletal protein [Urechidicola sp. P050]MDT0553642.1 polymer-forming cytoskeletal protein [Urechidicola sp. P050]OIQ36510.1 MAG: hypothetical protein BM563_10655 [Bacteroidetes bacterium MedPE-SWsnd-G1]